MRITSFIILCVVRVNFCSGQDFTALQRKADSLYKAGEYRTAAMVLSSSARLPNSQAPVLRAHIFAARCWTRANMFDSTFAALNRVAGSASLVYNNLVTVATEPDFVSVHKDPRWADVLKRMFNVTTRDCYTPIDASYTQEEIIYGRKDGMALTMLRLKPEKIKSNGRAIIHIRSGGWGSNFYMPGPLEALPFIRAGYNVFIVFHGSEPVYTVVDAVEDLQQAVRFIRYYAGSYSLTHDKIGVIGTSAGGHLALMCGLSDSSATAYSPDPVDRMSSKVQAVVSYFPVSDFLNWDGKGQVADSAFLFKELLPHALQFRHWDAKRRRFDYVTDAKESRAILKQISPTYHVSKNDAPVLLFHGDADELVPIQQSESLARKLRDAQVPLSFNVKKGAGHGWPRSEEESALLMSWFEKYLR